MTARLLEVRTLDGWREQWDDLVLHAPLPSPFLRSWWVETAATDLHLLLVVDGRDLLGGVALQRTRRLGLTVWEVAGGGKLCPDHLDVLAGPGHEQEVLEELGAWLRRQRACVLFLDGLVGEPLAALVWPGSLSELDHAPYGSLEGLTSGYLKSRSRNFQRSTAKTRNRLNALGVTFRRLDLADPAELHRAFTEIARMHHARGDRAELIANLPRLEQVLGVGAARGEVEAHVFELGERVVAVELVLVLAGAIRYYQIARDDDYELRGSGRELLLRVIEQAADRGFVEYDFLRGGEAYKDRMTDLLRPLMRLQVGHGLRGRLWLSGWHVGRTLRRLGREVPGRIRASFSRRRTDPAQRDPEVETPPRSR